MARGPHVSDPGSNWAQQVNCQRGQPHRRLDAGEANRGGEPRVCISGDQTAGGGHLRDAGGLARRVVQALGAGVAGVVAGVDLGGRRSSGELGVDATVAGETRAGTYVLYVAREGS